MILTKEVEVRPIREGIKYYKDKGYDAKNLKSIMVKVEDLQPKSNVYIDVQCDVCGEIYHIKYSSYTKNIENGGYYCCSKCSHVKVVETNRKKYNCDNVMQNKEIYIRQSNSLKNNYGVSTPLKNKEILYRAEKTTFKNFGVKCSLQAPEIKEKVCQSFYQNGTQKTSKQQLYLYNLYGGELNYPIRHYDVDICFPQEKLYIEYDGGGHDLRVTLGRLTQEEFDQKEIIRNNIIKREGYQQMRIISSKDKLPSDSTLLQMLQFAKQYFSQYPQHSWIEFNIDTSSLRSAEYKDDVAYDYGELRTIKDSDLNIFKEVA